MTIQIPNSSQLRMPAIALLSSFLGWLAVVVVAVALVFPTYPRGLGPLTSQEMQNSPGAYLFFQLVFLVPALLGAGGIIGLFNPLRAMGPRILVWLMLASAIAAMALVIVLVALRVGLVNFTDPTLGQNSTWISTSWGFDHVVGPAMAAATLMTGLALYISSLLRRIGLVVAILSGALIILSIVGAILPPAVLGLLWVALGIGLLRRRDGLIVAGAIPVESEDSVAQ